MRIHEQNRVLKDTLFDMETRLTEILSRMDSKTGCPDGMGEYSSMVNWNDIRSDLMQIRNDATEGKNVR